MSSLSGVFTTSVVLCLLFHAHFGSAAIYIVGDEDGWDPSSNPEVWPRGKTFYAGDILVFNYNRFLMDMCVVNQTAYDTCTINDGAQKYISGQEGITLEFGPNYFIDSVPSLCQAGMRMYVNALSVPVR